MAPGSIRHLSDSQTLPEVEQAFLTFSLPQVSLSLPRPRPPARHPPSPALRSPPAIQYTRRHTVSAPAVWLPGGGLLTWPQYIGAGRRRQSVHSPAPDPVPAEGRTAEPDNSPPEASPCAEWDFPRPARRQRDCWWRPRSAPPPPPVSSCAVPEATAAARQNHAGELPPAFHPDVPPSTSLCTLPCLSDIAKHLFNNRILDSCFPVVARQVF